MNKYIKVICCMDCPNNVAMTIYSGGCPVHRCAKTGQEIYPGEYSMDNCPLPELVVLKCPAINDAKD